MNIKIPVLEQLNESSNKSPLNKGDLFAYIDSSFPDNANSWKDATMEIVDMANWIYEVVLEMKGENLAAPLQDKTRSKTPKEWNTKHKRRIKEGFELLSNYQEKQFFETFGHWINQWKDRTSTLNENQQIKIDAEKEIEDVLKFKKNQFNFDCELFMGTIPSKLDTKFGLFWHAMNTNNMEEFVNSVSDFIALTKNSLSELDIERLQNHYIKYFTE